MTENHTNPPKGYHIFSDLEPERDPGSWGVGIDDENDNEYKTSDEAIVACYNHRNTILDHANSQMPELIRAIRLIEERTRPIYETTKWIEGDGTTTEVRTYRCRGCSRQNIGNPNIQHKGNCIWETARDTLADYEIDEERANETDNPAKTDCNSNAAP